MTLIGGLEQARAAKARVRQFLPKSAKVNGIGITRSGDTYAVKVNLSEAPREDLNLPAEIEGVPVIFEVVGRISKLSG